MLPAFLSKRFFLGGGNLEEVPGTLNNWFKMDVW